MIFAVMGSERWMKMEELNGYTPPASLNLSDFQDAIGDAVVQAIIKIGIRVNREELLKAVKYAQTQVESSPTANTTLIISLSEKPDPSKNLVP